MADENTNTHEEENTVSERTFTQDEVNRIVKERLAKERDRLKREQDALFAEREQEVAKREMRITAVEKLQEKGLPALLADAINCSSSESIEKSIEILSNTQDAHEGEKKPAYNPNGGRGISGDPIRAAMGL